jgi:predicted Zn-dependent protease with MMP-like domain
MNTDWYDLAEKEVRAVVAALPPDLRACLADLAITLDPRPTTDEKMQDGDDEALLGLFVGPCYAEAAGDSDFMPSAIRLFVENLREEAEEEAERFRQEVRLTLLHELGHFLGLDEKELEHRGLA